MARACSQGLGNLGSALPLEVAQGQNGAIAFWQEAEKVPHTHLDLLVSKCSVIAQEQLLLQAAQRTHLVLTLLLPMIDDCCTSCLVVPAMCGCMALLPH